MSANQRPIFVVAANVDAVTFVNADGTTPKALLTAGANGTKVLSIGVVSDDTVDRYLQLFLYDGATAYIAGTKLIPDLSGTNGTDPAIDLLDTLMLPWLDSDGEFFLPSGWSIRVAPTVAITAAKTMTVVGYAADY
jgi:hypothetical protein